MARNRALQSRTATDMQTLRPSVMTLNKTVRSSLCTLCSGSSTAFGHQKPSASSGLCGRFGETRVSQKGREPAAGQLGHGVALNLAPP
jgi:hypothetical protein